MKQLILTAALLWTSVCLPCFANDASPPPVKAAENPATATAKPSGPPQVLVVTNMGSFTVELNQERAPLTVTHFLAYVEQGFYNGTIFHRVVPNFVIQGGGLDTDYKIKPAPLKVVNESGNGLTNARGTIGAARGNDPHSSDAQFYINSIRTPPAGAMPSSEKSSRVWTWSTRSATFPPARTASSRRMRP
jgi:cyclophilin family peptidyl-prolyl cis-trans isomerase